MVTIKTKKEMNLPELIEWLWKSKKSVYKVTSNMNGVVKLEPYGLITFSSGDFYPEETFTVEVEEEITLTTPLPVMLHVWKTETLGTEIKEVENKSIASQYTICSTEFWLKQGDEMTLIWKNGRLVE